MDSDLDSKFSVALLNFFYWKQECIPVGCVPPARRPYLPGPGGGVPSRGCTWSGGCTCSGGCTWSQGVYLVWRGVPGWGVYLVQGGLYLVQGGVPGPGGCTWSGGVPGPGGVYLVPGGVPGQVLPPL